MTSKVDRKKKKFRLAAISRDNQTSSWTRRAEAREVEESVKKEICLTNSWNLSRLVILSVKEIIPSYGSSFSFVPVLCPSKVWSMSSLSVSLKSIFS